MRVPTRTNFYAALRDFTIGTGILLAATAGASAQDKTGWPDRITLATGPTGGFAYTMATPWASTVSTAVGIPISPESTAGIPINNQMVQSKTAEIAVGTSDIVIQGWRGEGFANGTKMQDVRAMLLMDQYVFQLYTDAKSDVKTLSDLNGRTVNPSRAGSGTDIFLRGIIDSLGIKPKEIVNVSPPQANDLMADGRLDAAAGSGNVPHPAPSQYEARTPIRLIGFTEAEVEKYLSGNPQLSRMVVPAGTFKGQDKDVVSIGSYIMFIVNKDVPASLVHALIKATFDNQKDLGAAYKSFAKLKLETIAGSPVKLHAGAVQYFEENGVKIPDSIK